jgi:hypothetical protein
MLVSIATFLVVLWSCQSNQTPAPFDAAVWMQRGDSITKITFDTLRNTLMRTLADSGFSAAIGVCQTGAEALTNSYVGEGVSVRRTTLKPRNAANAADTMEMRLLQAMAKLQAAGTSPTPVVEQSADGKAHYFKPIMLQALCLNCHGQPQTDIKPEVWQALQKAYPADSAHGYHEGDLRGMWHVVFASDK